MSLKLSW